MVNSIIWFITQPQQAAVCAKGTVQTRRRISSAEWKQIKLILPLDKKYFGSSDLTLRNFLFYSVKILHKQGCIVKSDLGDFSFFALFCILTF